MSEPPKLDPNRKRHREGLVYGMDDRPAQHIHPLTFVGGTGRSGTHVVSHFLGRHKRIQTIPVECRFHTDDRGFPGLFDGTVSLDQFTKRMRGFWWKGRLSGRDRGMYKFMPRERLDEALAEFERDFDPAEPEPACRKLFVDLLWPRAVENQASAIVEQSCDTIAVAPVLLRLFPDAKFVHVVRDGRDSSASRVSQSRGRVYPRTRMQGIRWFEKRMRRIEAGAQQIPEDQLIQVSLEEILTPPRFEEAKEVANFVGVRLGQRMRRYFFARMSMSHANAVRWKRGLSERKQAKIEKRYVAVIERFEREGISTAPILRRVYEARIATPPPLPPEDESEGSDSGGAGDPSAPNGERNVARSPS